MIRDDLTEGEARPASRSTYLTTVHCEYRIAAIMPACHAGDGGSTPPTRSQTNGDNLIKRALPAVALFALAACGSTTAPAGGILPNRTLTPGATNPAVTQATIHQTICVKGWTATIRPPVSYTEPLKIKQLRSGYTYQGNTSPKFYEEDHLIPLEIGGSPTSAKNLWPEPHSSAEGSYVKDKLENEARKRICASPPTLTLAAARKGFATNWWAFYQKIFKN